MWTYPEVAVFCTLLQTTADTCIGQWGQDQIGLEWLSALTTRRAFQISTHHSESEDSRLSHRSQLQWRFPSNSEEEERYLTFTDLHEKG